METQLDGYFAGHGFRQGSEVSMTATGIDLEEPSARTKALGELRRAPTLVHSREFPRAGAARLPDRHKSLLGGQEKPTRDVGLVTAWRDADTHSKAFLTEFEVTVPSHSQLARRCRGAEQPRYCDDDSSVPERGQIVRVGLASICRAGMRKKAMERLDAVVRLAGGPTARAHADGLESYALFLVAANAFAPKRSA